MREELTASNTQLEIAWQNSFLADLPAPLKAQLLDGASWQRPGPGELLLRGGATADMAGVYLVVDGLVRVYLRGRDGRQATVRYAVHGEVIGLPPLLVPGMTIWAETVTGAEMVRFPSRRFIALAERNVALAWPTARYVALQLSSTNDVLAADIFLPVRARIARHLLDLAQREGDELVVSARHQDIADAIGSVREVVSREMKRLGADGLIKRVADKTVIEDPAQLHQISSGLDATKAA